MCTYLARIQYNVPILLCSVTSSKLPTSAEHTRHIQGCDDSYKAIVDSYAYNATPPNTTTDSVPISLPISAWLNDRYTTRLPTCVSASIPTTSSKAIADNKSWPNQSYRSSSSQRACYTSPLLSTATAHKRMSLPEQRDTSIKKSRGDNWLKNCDDATAFLLNFDGRVTNGVSERYDKNNSQIAGHPATPNNWRHLSSETKIATACSKSARRTPITTWSANDVYDFVLSSPHAARCAKVLLSGHALYQHSKTATMNNI